MEATSIRSGRETTQPNRQDTAYWATGLTPVYLEGALERALNPLHRPAQQASSRHPIFDGPRAGCRGDAARARKRVESVLRLPQGRVAPAQPALRAVRLAPREYHRGLRSQRAGDTPDSGMPPRLVLVELIVAAVRERTTAGGESVALPAWRGSRRASEFASERGNFCRVRQVRLQEPAQFRDNPLGIAGLADKRIRARGIRRAPESVIDRGRNDKNPDVPGARHLP